MTRRSRCRERAVRIPAEAKRRSQKGKGAFAARHYSNTHRSLTVHTRASPQHFTISNTQFLEPASPLCKLLSGIITVPEALPTVLCSPCPCLLLVTAFDTPPSIIAAGVAGGPAVLASAAMLAPASDKF